MPGYRQSDFFAKKGWSISTGVGWSISSGGACKSHRRKVVNLLRRGLVKSSALSTYQMKRYLDYITNGGFYEFEANRERTIGTINDYKRHFRYFMESIAGSEDIKTIRIDEIQKDHIDLFHKYITKKTSSPKSYNNIMSSLRSFFNHLIKYEELPIKNVFEFVPVQSVYYDNKTFTWVEFKKVLAATSLENGYDPEYKRNRFKEWLPTAFKLGVLTCLRLDELIHLQYRDIIKDGDVQYIQAINRKASKLIGNNKNERVKRTPVIPELRKVLDEECYFRDLEGEDEYIIAPEMSRSSARDIIIKGFTHFKRMAGIDEKKCFKDLRKTYISRHRAEYGDNGLTSIISDHSNQVIVDKHYTAQIDAVRKSMDFRVFPDAESGDSQGF